MTETATTEAGGGSGGGRSNKLTNYLTRFRRSGRTVGLVWGVCFVTVFFSMTMESRNLKVLGVTTSSANNQNNETTTVTAWRNDEEINRLQTESKKLEGIIESLQDELQQQHKNSKDRQQESKSTTTDDNKEEAVTKQDVASTTTTTSKADDKTKAAAATTKAATAKADERSLATSKTPTAGSSSESSPPPKQAAKKSKDTSTKTTSNGHPTMTGSRFTPHVTQIIQTIENTTLHRSEEAKNPWWYQPQKYCPQGYHIYVDKPYSPPTAIECHPDTTYCGLLRLIFKDGKRVLPYNVSIGTSSADMIKKDSMAWGQCLGSSGPEGLFSMTNFQNAKIVTKALSSGGNTTITGFHHVYTKSWEERNKVPVFRGHARVPVKGYWKNNPQKECSKMTVKTGGFGHRAKAALFSLENPALLNARVSKVENICSKINGDTNGLHQVAGTGNYSRNEDVYIPSSQYYTDYQTVVVLGGIGAAFRTPEHMAAGQAVVLQHYHWQEWFYPYMEPYVHYIPLKKDLSDLQQAMEFVKDNPTKVKEIAQNGKKFYEEWLNYDVTVDHWHELLWRLSETIHEKGPERLKTGSLRTLWPGAIIPKRYIRRSKTAPPDGTFILEDKQITSKPYAEIDAKEEEKKKKKTKDEPKNSKGDDDTEPRKNDNAQSAPETTPTKDATTTVNQPTLPESIFTTHVNEIVDTIDKVTLHLPEESTNPWQYQPGRFCPLGFQFYVDKPYSPPSAIECNPTSTWCSFFQRIFADGKRVLPYNVSIGASSADMIKKDSMAWGQCIGSSGPEGLFSMNNFQNAKVALKVLASNATSDYDHVHTKTWEERHKIPMFRGHARVPVKGSWGKFPERECSKKTVEKGDFGHRSRAVLFSLKHPDLLDARVSKLDNPCLSYNGATNGLHKVAGIGNYTRDENVKIPPSEYYTNYQTVVVLGGIGAAFRTPEHMAAGQAVVLQRFTFEEWFYPFMTPYVHYIPVKNDLSDLKEALEFVRDNPDKVKEIAQNGKKFYEEWLSVSKTADHWHELLWRLSEMIHEKGPERLKTGTVRSIWPAPFIPMRYVREKATDTSFKLQSYEKTRQPYWEVDGPPDTRETCKKNPGTDWCY